jgi:hypothetical protein
LEGRKIKCRLVEKERGSSTKIKEEEELEA